MGVIGCGWLGLPLAVELNKSGYTVRGTTSTRAKLPVLQENGISPYEIILRPSEIIGPIDDFLDQMNVLIINVPPGMRGGSGESYIDKMTELHSKIKEAGVTKLIFVSSTSVYGSTEGEIDEDTPVDPITESAKHLVAAENMFLADDSLETSILRFGGLIGPDRHPVTMLSGKEGLKNGDDFVNLIHRDDCIHMILTILQNDWWHEIFNGVYPDHPKKSDYYVEEATKRGLKPPGYLHSGGPAKGKLIKSRNFLIKGQSFFTSIH